MDYAKKLTIEDDLGFVKIILSQSDVVKKLIENIAVAIRILLPSNAKYGVK